jgi:hypothetical protein
LLFPSVEAYTFELSTGMQANGNLVLGQSSMKTLLPIKIAQPFEVIDG